METSCSSPSLITALDDPSNATGTRKRPRPNSDNGSDSKNKNNKTESQSSLVPSFEIKWLSSSASDSDDDVPTEKAHLDALVTFPRPSSATNDKTQMLCLMGRAQVQCVKGSISLLGYRLDPSCPKVPVESPPWSSILVMEPIHTSTQTETKDGDNKGRDNDDSVIIKVESWWPQQDQSAGSEDHQSQEPTFEIVSGAAKGVRPTQVPSTWKHAADQIVPCLIPNNNNSTRNDADTKGAPQQDGSSTCRLAICGGKGVGKSTFLRYMTNRILSRDPPPQPKTSDQNDNTTPRQVAILDADVGQPEMSPPGMVTLTVVSEPLLTPPHYRSLERPLPSSKRSQQFAYFFGSVTSKNDPERYMALIQRLVRHYQEDVNNDIPLLINLDGWVKQLGFELLSTLLTSVLTPLTHVVQILGTTKSKQFTLRGDVLNPETSSATLHVIHSYDSFLNATFDNNNHNNDTIVSNNNSMKPEATKSTPTSCVMPAQALRDLRLCTYFLNDATIWYNLGFDHEGIGDDTCEIAHRLAGARPYAVPFEAVQIRWAGSDHFSDLTNINDSDDNNRKHNDRKHNKCEEDGSINDWVLDAINAKIVGLCYRDDANNDGKDGSHEQLGCVGLGLVRAIDRVQRVFYVLTPVDSHRLKDVNVLVGCGMDVPVEFWFRGVSAEAVPYQTFAPSTATVGGDPMKSRNNIGRRGLAK
ncbi:Polynucleotide 5'-hydroxyl-kinase [Seminavis robusta]|uniref:Polynucleotide 5'-hydroxyl-kinase n=1 Tax=Seminavis robusta TaxID=568900 RepID=A0A9N8EIM5_9STRA|nr:Polynucleotide 5'-hydroxyl-kinase [Seminavis robusta]|eukprot:Sro1059_g236520.1 Polynucleotide 5'-hydroxyl-kinase (697) ;mRNA; f:15039-17129